MALTLTLTCLFPAKRTWTTECKMSLATCVYTVGLSPFFFTFLACVIVTNRFSPIGIGYSIVQ